MEIIIENKYKKEIKFNDILSDNMTRFLNKNSIIIENISSSPINILINLDSIIVNLSEFATENDYEITKRIIKNIDDILNTKTKMDIDFEKELRKNLENIKDRDIILDFINRKVFLSKELIIQLLSKENLLSEYSKFIYQVQYTKGYDVKFRSFYDDNFKIINMYYVNRNSNTIMQYIPFESSLDDSFISIIDKINDKYETLNVLKYSDFFEKIDKNDFYFIDSNNIVIKEKFNLKR